MGGRGRKLYNWLEEHFKSHTYAHVHVYDLRMAMVHVNDTYM